MMFGKEGFWATVEVIDDVFVEMESANIAKALQGNEEYQRLQHEADGIVMGNPRLELLINQEEAVALSREDTKELLNYLEKAHRMEELFRVELYKYAQDAVIKQLVRAVKR